MTIDPNQLLFGQNVKPKKKKKFTSAGAYGESIATPNLPANKRPKPAPEQVFGPYYQTQTGLEVPEPGESADSTQARTLAAEKEAEDKAKNPPPPPTPLPPPPASPLTPPSGKDGTDTGTGSDGSQGTRDDAGFYYATDGTRFTDQLAFANYQASLNQDKFNQAAASGERRSAFALLKEEFNRYGLGDLVGDIEKLTAEGIGPAEFSLRLRQTTPYKNRFKANEARIGAGLAALTEAEYISLEDQYQNVMRRYGLPASFYAKDGQGRQANLEKFISGDVSPAELEDRVQLAVNRVDKAAPGILRALETYYGGPGGISKSNLVAYVLDPQRALPDIQRKIQAAEIGAAAETAGFGLGALRAEELAARGITQAQAQQGYQTAAEIIPRAGQLADIYGAEKYDQTAAEQEIFGLEGAASARRKRQRLTGMEQAQFGAQTGLGASALERGRSGAV